jgi:hypothetical protein
MGVGAGDRARIAFDAAGALTYERAGFFPLGGNASAAGRRLACCRSNICPLRVTNRDLAMEGALLRPRDALGRDRISASLAASGLSEVGGQLGSRGRDSRSGNDGR